MTYYHQEVLRIKKEVYPNDYLDEPLVRAKKFIAQNFSKELTLEEMARTAHLSKFHFLRLFKIYYGRTPYQYLKEVRLTEAKNQLRRGIPITSICFSLGFSSITSFTAFFRSGYGMTPSHYRKKNLDQKPGK